MLKFDAVENLQHIWYLFSHPVKVLYAVVDKLLFTFNVRSQSESPMRMHAPEEFRIQRIQRMVCVYVSSNVSQYSSVNDVIRGE